MTFLSVALCTYNAELYLPAQLESLATQRRKPDELVVCDDGSQDYTCKIVRAFANYAPFAVRLINNAHNLGSTKNFEQAIQLCTGDVIALADQDDVWLPNKLAVLEEVLIRHPEVGLVFSDAEVVNQELRSLDYRLWASLRFTAREQRRMTAGEQVQILLKHQIVTGATLIFRAQFRDKVLPIPPVWVHDGWIALVIACLAPLMPVCQPLIRYRQHSRSQIGAPPRSFTGQVAQAQDRKRDLRLRNVEQYQAARARLLEIGGVSDPVLRLFEEKIEHLRVRAALPEARLARWPDVAREALTGRYSRYSSGYLSIVKDLWQAL